MSFSTLPLWSSWGLPTPKVRLNNVWSFVSVDRYKYWGNSIWGQYSIFRYPEVVAMDITQDQIEKWIYVEMLAYHRGKYWRDINNDSAYKVPSSWIWWINTLQSIYPWILSTRWWSSKIHMNMWWWNLLVDKPNHYKVNSQNEVINVWQYLNNRMTIVPVSYRDISWLDQSIECLCPANWLRRFSNTPWSRFWYSARYTPYYFRFRYIMKDENWYWFISWPLSPIIKMTQEEHPFKFDAVASTINNSVCVNINTSANNTIARCMFETKLP